MRTTLGRLLDAIDALDPDATIYAPASRPLYPEAPAALQAGDTGVSAPPENTTDLTYLLEVRLAREAIEVWSAWRRGRVPTTNERVEAVAFYADNDSYLPADE